MKWCRHPPTHLGRQGVVSDTAGTGGIPTLHQGHRGGGKWFLSIRPVIRHVREKVVCRACEAIAQQPAPSHPIARGREGPSCWPMSCSPGTACTCRSIVRATSTSVKASTSTYRRSRKMLLSVSYGRPPWGEKIEPRRIR